jgi:hypothetical protein
MKSLEKISVFALCSLLLPASAVKAQVGVVAGDARTKPALVVLGTYHMGTPGNNVVNPKVADVTTPQRQKQMVELVEKLKQFKPTKVVVECDTAMPLQADGEDLGDVVEAVFEAERDALDVIVV